MNNKYDYDIIVIGGGHAGIEAALAAARMGANTAIFIINEESIGRMSCNPSIGGPAKGHLAREIDALGGELARVADITGIQFRMLNKKKGPAVWAPRSQNDRYLYSAEMKNVVLKQPNLELLVEEVADVLTEKMKNNTAKKIRTTGVQTVNGKKYYAPRVIIAGGTFFNGLIHIGKESYPSGRDNEPASLYLSRSLEKMGLRLGRFKTGTPPRIDLNTLNYNLVEEQPGDEPPEGFSYYRGIDLKNLISCFLTYTNKETHRIIEDNIKESALYGGRIRGTGPRYCPSIEDKIVRFPDKEMHHLFIEPEGLSTNEGYVNGISTSLPAQIQDKLVKSIPALNKAKILKYGYAIEYDYVIPGQIETTMEIKRIAGLYTAGQINGTSGYEEAAAQGLMAGVNAILSMDNKDPFILDRGSSYIGVLIDDLIIKGTNEPYRMFTSRAEYRLFLRQDNADERLMPLGYKLGLVSSDRWSIFRKTMQIIHREIEFLKNNNTRKKLTPKNKDRQAEPIKYAALLKRPEVTLNDLIEYGYSPPTDVSKSIWSRISLQIKYEGYLKRQQQDIEKFRQIETLIIPQNIEYSAVKTITMEAREKLTKVKPKSLGQAARISGVNYTDITSLMVYLKRNGFIS